jgi:hypothetical protein
MDEIKAFYGPAIARITNMTAAADAIKAFNSALKAKSDGIATRFLDLACQREDKAFAVN